MPTTWTRACGPLEELAAALPLHPEIIDVVQISALRAADRVMACASLAFVPRESFDSL